MGGNIRPEGRAIASAVRETQPKPRTGPHKSTCRGLARSTALRPPRVMATKAVEGRRSAAGVAAAGTSPSGAGRCCKPRAGQRRSDGAQLIGATRRIIDIVGLLMLSSADGHPMAERRSGVRGYPNALAASAGLTRDLEAWRWLRRYRPRSSVARALHGVVSQSAGSGRAYLSAYRSVVISQFRKAPPARPSGRPEPARSPDIQRPAPCARVDQRDDEISRRPSSPGEYDG